MRSNLTTASVWRGISLGISALVLLPVAALLWQATGQPSELLTDNLALYLRNTLLLLAGVGAVVISIGVICGWLIANCSFPLSRLLGWGLLLPLAMPGYIAAYVYTDLLDYAGPVQSVVRELGDFSGPDDYFFPAIRSLGGAIVVLGLVLYPYVYLLLRAAFAEQSRDMYQAARLLGMSHWRVALRVHLPLARPALITGAALAMLEAVGDFGTVDYFAVATLLTGSYDLWLSLADLPGAARLALLLTTTAMLVLGLERYSRRRRRYYSSATMPLPKTHLTGWRGWLATLACICPLLFGFVLPVAVLGVYAVEYFSASIKQDYLPLLANSLKLAGFTMLLTLVLGLLVVYAQRVRDGKKSTGVMQYTRVICSLGYATPGAVLAIGVLFPFAAFDHTLADLLADNLGMDVGLLLTGSLGALVLALAIRFLAISSGALEANLAGLSPRMDMAARTLGHSQLAVFARFHLPLLQSGIISAGLIVFVDAMKELPATLILRPFNFDTLATQVYFFAGDEQIELAALGCLSIVVPSAIAMLLVHRVEYRRRLEKHS